MNIEKIKKQKSIQELLEFGIINIEKTNSFSLSFDYKTLTVLEVIPQENTKNINKYSEEKINVSFNISSKSFIDPHCASGSMVLQSSTVTGLI